MQERQRLDDGRVAQAAGSDALAYETTALDTSATNVSMHDVSIHDANAQDSEPRPLHWPSRPRMLLTGGLLLLLLLLFVVPPLVKGNRYKRQIVASISLSLGRPVRIGDVSLTMLPLPGLTLTDFVVGEDPAFGAEPVIRADSVRVTLRWRSFWRRRVEIARITLDDPSVNLVRLPDGRWNLESILLQAARMPAAPTGQKAAGDRPRFPYIEATGARVNLKMGLEKMPLSLTEAKFSLWLPQPEQWRLRLEGHPVRTDAAATDTGTIQLEGTLGKAGRVEEVPVELHGRWSGAPLGAASWVLLGRDAGWRGDLNLAVAIRGRFGDNAVESELKVANLRRADFVPLHTLQVDLHCTAEAANLFRSLRQARCEWPADSGQGGLVVSGQSENVMQPDLFSADAAWQGVPAEALLDTLRIVSPRVSPALAFEGTLSGHVTCCVAPVGTAEDVGAKLSLADDSSLQDSKLSATLASGRLTVPSIPLTLGGTSPAVLDVEADRIGYRMHLLGSAQPARLLALASALPQFGDGLADIVQASDTPVRLDLQSARTWGGPQTWTSVVAPPARHRRRH